MGRAWDAYVNVREVDGGRHYRVATSFGRSPDKARRSEARAVLKTVKVAPFQPPSPVQAAQGRRLKSHGITLRLLPGWRGTVNRNVITARRPGISLRLEEMSRQVMAGMRGWLARPPITLGQSEFVRPPSEYEAGGELMTQRYFTSAGRFFILEARMRSDPPDARRLAQANSILASLGVRRGDFYPGAVRPPRFRPSPGWNTHHSGRARVTPDGESGDAWAATVPLVIDGVPPHRMLEHLPRDGNVMYLGIYSPPFRTRPLVRRFPRLTRADGPQGWEGQSLSLRHVSLFRSDARTRQYNVELWVFFGRSHPAASQWARAQAELRRLVLPFWRADRPRGTTVLNGPSS